MIEQINHIAQLWFSGAIAMFWQVGVLIILIGCVDLIIRRWAWPQLRYALWLMVLVKLVLPPTISLSTSITSGLEPLARQIATKEIQRENLNATTAMILANLETAVADTPDEVASSPTIVTEQPAVVVTGSELVTGKSLNTAYVKLTWQAYAMAIWLAGMFMLGGWLIIKLLHLRKEDHKLASTESLSESFYDAMTRCAKSLGLRRVPKVVLTRRVACPAVFGIIRPVLLMPVGYISKMTRSDTEHMLLHELAHIKRGDLCVHGFYMLLQVVYWYNPLLWRVRGQMHHLRELCCDATVARLLKERISEYRQTLIDVARRYLTKPTEPGLGLLGLFEDSNRLLVRLNWLKKETWRYQKMKKLTVITTIVLMLAFVIPMAQAQDKSSNEDSNSGSIQVEEQQSQSIETVVVEPEQLQTQQQSSQAMQALQKQLQQLEIEKQKLQHELHALENAQHTQQNAEHTEHQAALKAKEAALKVKDKAAKAKAQAEATKAKAKAIQWQQQALKMKQWAQQYAAQFNSPEFQKQINNLEINAMVQWANSDEFKQWEKEIENWSQQWAESDEFKQWQKDVQQWSKELAEAHEAYTEAHVEAKSSGHAHPPAPEHHPMPVMPPMPPMPAMPPMPVNVDIPVLPKVSQPEVAPPAALPVLRSSGTNDGTAPILPGETASTGRAAQDVEVKKDEDGKYVATRQMQFTSKVKPGAPVVIRNNQGRIVMHPSKDGKCDVRAVIKAKAKTEAEARAKVEQIGMTVNSTEERYYLEPIKRDAGEWKDLNVDLFITVPPGIEPDLQTNMGSVELYDFKGKIKAVTNMGAIKAVNTTGNVDLLTNMGAIEFIAPKNLSAKFNIQNKMGSIESELPLEVKKLDMFRTNADGTIGTGRDNITMATNMGKISLKWQSSSQVEPKF